MRSFSHWIIGLFTSPAGIVVLAALDSTIFFSLPLGIDTAVVLLSARLRTLAWIAPLLATAGSLGGAALTFWLGRKIGEKGLDRFVASGRLKKVRARINRSGAVALAILDLIPPPFPFSAFVLAAGALDVRATLFFVTLASVRLIRFGAEAVLAVLYGQGILAWIESDVFHDIVSILTLSAFAATAVSLVKLIRAARTSGPRAARRAPA